MLVIHKNRIKNSPFLIGALAGLGVTAADTVWMVSELLTHEGIISDTTYVYIRLLVLLFLILGLAVIVLSITKYITRGYIMEEVNIEKAHFTKARDAKRLGKIKQ